MFGLFGKPSRVKFAKLVSEAAQKAGFTDKLTFDEAEFTLRHSRGIMYLENTYGVYCKASGTHRKRILENLVSAMVTKAEETTRAQAIENCVAVIREHALFSFIELRRAFDKNEAKPIAYVPISDWYVRALVIDAPGSMRVVNEDDLKAWEITFEELFEVGLERLRDATGPKFREESGYFVGTWNDDYDSSRALLQDVFKTLPIRGEPVFCIPNRLTLMVADSDNPAGVAKMVSKAEEIVQTLPRPQNPGLLTYRDGRIVDVDVDQIPTLRKLVQRSRGICALMYYDEQKQILEKLHKARGKDIFVAKFTLKEMKNGEFVSFSVWSRDVVTLLPKTDMVMFFDGDRPKESQVVGVVKWEDVMSVAGDLMLDTEMFPARYYVSKFPSEAQLAELPRQGF